MRISRPLDITSVFRLRSGERGTDAQVYVVVAACSPVVPGTRLIGLVKESGAACWVAVRHCIAARWLPQLSKRV